MHIYYDVMQRKIHEEQPRHIDSNIFEASHSDDGIDFQPVWEVSKPLDRVEQDTNVGKTGKESQPSVFVYISICTNIIHISSCDGTSKLCPPHRLRYTFIAPCVVEL